MNVRYLFGHVVDAVQVWVNHTHDLMQRLTLKLTHGKHSLVQTGARTSSQSFLKDETRQKY